MEMEPIYIGLPTKCPFRVMDKQCGNVRGIIKPHNMEDRWEGGYLAEFAM